MLWKGEIIELERTVNIAVCQQEIVFENKYCNLKKIFENVLRAKKDGADIIFFPEMTLTGFSMNIAKTSERDFDNINKIKKIAAENNISIGFGWVKPAGAKAENHYSVVSSVGEIVFDYVKIHPFSYAKEDMFFYSGEKVYFFNINGVEFSAFICYDLRFPEIFQAASKNADIIVVAANWPFVRKEHWECLLKARAIENQCYIIGINCFGWQENIYYSGNSCIFNPDGKKVCSFEEKESIMVFKLLNDTERYRKGFPVKKDRKIDMYKKLL